MFLVLQLTNNKERSEARQLSVRVWCWGLRRIRLPCRHFSAVRPCGMHEAGCAGRRGPGSWTESRAVRTAVRACSCSAGRGPSLAGCKVAGNALHDRPWAWPGRALQSRVSCAASCKQPTQIVVVASQDLPSHFRAPFRPGDCQRFPSGSCMAGTMFALSLIHI